MATIPFNGSQTVFRFKRSGDPDFVDVVLQKDLSSDASRKMINYDNKTSGDREVFLTGIATETLKISVFMSDDDSYQSLYEAFDLGETIEVAMYRSDDQHPVEGTSLFTLIKSASGVIEKLSEKHAHESVVMSDIDVKISGKWTFA